MQKTKICHVTSVHPAFDIRIFHKECVSLQNAGYDTHLTVLGVEDTVKNGVKIVGVKKNYSNRVLRMTASVKSVINRALELDADIYHLHDPELLPYSYLLRRKNKIVVYDSHEDLPRQTMNKEYLSPILRPVVAWGLDQFEKFICSQINAVVTATPSIKERFNKFHDYTVNINNYPLLSEFPPNLGQNEARALKREKIRSACYIGTIARVRGAKEIVEAIGYTSGRLLLAGSMSEKDLLPNLEKILGWQKVDNKGLVERQEVAQILESAMVGLVTLHPAPNHIEALPIKMFEYLAAGLPIVASNFPLWQTLLAKYECARFVDPLNPKQIAEAIQWFFDHPKEAKEMGLRGRAAVETEFNWNSEEKKLIEMYEHLLEKKNQ